jgi:CRP-like cAMP-binding protein
VVEAGTVEIVRHRVDGTDEVLARRGPGAYVGEYAPLFAQRRSATARAHGSAVVTG